MEQFNLFVGVFLAFCLVFLSSLYMKYGKTLTQRDKTHHQCQCPGHSHNHNETQDNNKPTSNVVVTPSNAESTDQYDIHKLAQSLRSDPNNEVLIQHAFALSLQVLTQIPRDIKVSTVTQLKLYGLFKQSHIGDINVDEPTKLYYAEHAKWMAWNQCKGKTPLNAKREYFEVVYTDIIAPSGLNVLLYDNAEDVPQHLKPTARSTSNKASQGFNMAVNSKIADEFDEELHGDPDELFNRFDLTEDEVDVEEIKLYIERNNININKQNENGTTFLNFAVDNNKYFVSKLLIEEFKANVNLCDDMGYTPLHSAAMNENKDIIELLLKHGADINAKSKDDDEKPIDLAESNDIKQLLTV